MSPDPAAYAAGSTATAFMIREMGGRGRSGAAFRCKVWFGTMINACVSQLAAFAEIIMHDLFTDGAHDVLLFANQEAARYGHEYIGTEHLLLGLATDDEGVAGRVFKDLGLRSEAIRSELEKIIAPLMPGNLGRRLPQTPKVKKVIEYAITQARDLGHNYVGAEHLLLGLVHDGDNVAAQVLLNLGVNQSLLRAAVFQALGVAAPADAAFASPLTRRAILKVEQLIDCLHELKYDAVASGAHAWAAALASERDRLVQLKERLTNTKPD